MGGLQCNEDDSDQGPIDEVVPHESVCAEALVWFANDCRDGQWFADELGIEGAKSMVVQGYAPLTQGLVTSSLLGDFAALDLRFEASLEIAYSNGDMAILALSDDGLRPIVERAYEVTLTTDGAWSFMTEALYSRPGPDTVAVVTEGLGEGPESSFLPGTWPGWWEMRGSNSSGSRWFVYGTDFPVFGINHNSVGDAAVCELHGQSVKHHWLEVCLQNKGAVFQTTMDGRRRQATRSGMAVGGMTGLAVIAAGLTFGPGGWVATVAVLGGGAATGGTAGTAAYEYELNTSLHEQTTLLKQRNEECTAGAEASGTDAQLQCLQGHNSARANEAQVLELIIPLPPSGGRIDCPQGTEFRQAGAPIYDCVNTTVIVEGLDGDRLGPATRRRHCRHNTLRRDSCVRVIDL